MGEVDDPALGADRVDRLAERHPARDLLVEEEPDHLALVVGLHLLARDHDEVAAACELDRLEGAAEDVVVGDRDRAEALRLGVVEQLLDRDRAVVRPARCACAGRRRSSRGRRAGRRFGQRRLDGAGRGRARRARRRQQRSSAARRPRGLACPRARGSRRPRRGAAARRPPARAARAGPAARRSRHRPRPPRARRGRARRAQGRRSPPRSSSGALVAPSRSVRTRTRPRSARGTRAGRRAACVRRKTSSQSGQRAQRPHDRAGQRALARSPLEHDESALVARAEALEVDAGRDHAVVAGEALGRGLGGRLRGRDERVDPAEQPLALRLARRVAEPLGREEGRDREGPRVAQREVREARQARLEAVHDVVARRAPARARGSPARRPARRSGCAARPARPGRARSARAAPPSSSARRPAIRSAARVEGASTVTSWPRSRSSCATPATCSLTSCGLDQANGVTRQTRRAMSGESSPARVAPTPSRPPWPACACACG